MQRSVPPADPARIINEMRKADAEALADLAMMLRDGIARLVIDKSANRDKLWTAQMTLKLAQLLEGKAQLELAAVRSRKS